MTFRKGDTVVCVDNINAETNFKEGRIYTVREETEGGFVKVEGAPGSWRCARFKSAPRSQDTYLLTVRVPAPEAGTLVDHLVSKGYEIDFFAKGD